MKKLFLIMAIILPMVVFMGCSSDDEDNLPFSIENFVGTWKLSKVNGTAMPGLSATMTINTNNVVLNFTITDEDGDTWPYNEEYVYTLNDGGKVHMENQDDGIIMDITITKLTKNYLKIKVDNWESSLTGFMDYSTMEFAK